MQHVSDSQNEIFKQHFLNRDENEKMDDKWIGLAICHRFDHVVLTSSSKSKSGTSSYRNVQNDKINTNDYVLSPICQSIIRKTPLLSIIYYLLLQNHEFDYGFSSFNNSSIHYVAMKTIKNRIKKTLFETGRNILFNHPY